MNFFKSAVGGGSFRKGYDLDALKGDIVEKVSAPIMMVDRDFVVTYVNQPTTDLLRANADAFKKLWPSLDPEKIVGMCIDTFHKNPSHQRKLLADPSRLPFKTEITVGDLKIALHISGSFDRKGNYVGNVLEWRDVTGVRLNEGMMNAIGRAQAVIEFSLDGRIQHANENFLRALGYTLDEIKGQHHSMFVDPAYRASADYKAFWEKLGRGEFDAGQYKRFGKGGKEIWIQASYNPILDASGKPFKVVKFATDITAQKLQAADFEGQLAAINKAQAVISFALDGKILDANENFLKTLGYTQDEIKGRHHSMFVDPAYRASVEYKAFWEKLGRGEFDAGQYRRVGKGGKEVWIQASYNPIMDASGRPFKVVKYATDTTAQVKASEALKTAVAETQQVIESAKANDLTARVPMDGKVGEIAALCGGINDLIAEMGGVITQIKSSAKEVSNAAAEISTSTTDLSQRTEEQAAGLEETSASMEEIAATVKKNAENAQQANSLTANTREVADKGGAVVAKAVEAMSRIEDSSSKIADIIGVIDEIARQTNLLALNAAVEAARAGDAGRGFAVVASEVRSLAQRSSQAAKDIKDLITNSSSQVKDGVDLVNRAGQSLSEIVASIKNVADIVADIATASNEQATGIEQVNKALTQMDEVTQQNSALVEENAATAKTLESQSKAMDEQVGKFIVQTGPDRDVRTASPRRPASAVRGPVGQMHSKLATALKQEEWSEF